MNNSGQGLGTWNKAQNGYFKFNNGIIIQWGVWANGTTTFPTPFTTANIGVADIGEYSYNQKDNYISAITATGFTATIQWTTSRVFRYVAIGY